MPITNGGKSIVLEVTDYIITDYTKTNYYVITVEYLEYIFSMDFIYNCMKYLITSIITDITIIFVSHNFSRA